MYLLRFARNVLPWSVPSSVFSDEPSPADAYIAIVLVALACVIIWIVKPMVTRLFHIAMFLLKLLLGIAFWMFILQSFGVQIYWNGVDQSMFGASSSMRSRQPPSSSSSYYHDDTNIYDTMRRSDEQRYYPKQDHHAPPPPLRRDDTATSSSMYDIAQGILSTAWQYIPAHRGEAPPPAPPSKPVAQQRPWWKIF